MDFQLDKNYTNKHMVFLANHNRQKGTKILQSVTTSYRVILYSTFRYSFRIEQFVQKFVLIQKTKHFLINISKVFLSLKAAYF